MGKGNSNAQRTNASGKVKKTAGYLANVERIANTVPSNGKGRGNGGYNGKSAR